MQDERNILSQFRNLRKKEKLYSHFFDKFVLRFRWMFLVTFIESSYSFFFFRRDRRMISKQQI